MKQKKRLAAGILSAALVLLLLAGCGGGSASGPASGSTSGSTSGSASQDPASSEKPAESDPASDPEPDETTEWKDSRTMAFFTKAGITPENVSFRASYGLKDSDEKNIVSYQARGDKAVLICYKAEDLQPYQAICKYGTEYYLGVYEDDGSVAWYKADDFSVTEFEAVRQICKIPTSTEVSVGYQVMSPDTEVVSLSHVPYRFELNAQGVPATVRTVYRDGNKNGTYEAAFTALQPCPAGTVFEKPVVKDPAA